MGSGTIPHITIQIRIVSFKTNWVDGEPTADGGVVPAVDVVLEGGGNVKGFAGVGEEDWIGNIAAAVFAGNDVAVSVVDDVGGGDETDGGLLDDVANGTEVVGEGP